MHKRIRRSQGPHVIRWRFTDNGEAGKEGKELTAEAWVELPAGVRFLTWQMERAPSTGHLHLQGYLELTTSQYVSYLHRNVSPTARFQVANATGEENCGYVHKVDSRVGGPWTLGQMGKTKQQGGFRDFVKAIREGSRMRDLIYSHPAMIARYKSFYWAIRATIMPKREEGEIIEVILALGKTGTGKTRYGYDKWRADKGGYWKMPVNNGTVWFDGYDGQDIVQWDESSGKFSSMKLTALLEYLDRYPILVPVKGGHTWWLPRVIYLTTNIHPRDWYEYDGREDQREALKRRFTQVLDFDKKHNGEPAEVDLKTWNWGNTLGFELFQEPDSYGVRPINSVWNERQCHRDCQRKDRSRYAHN